MHDDYHSLVLQVMVLVLWCIFVYLTIQQYHVLDDPGLDNYGLWAIILPLGTVFLLAVFPTHPVEKGTRARDGDYGYVDVHADADRGVDGGG